MRRILYLDGLRGWAALFVLFHHLLLAFAPDGHEAGIRTSPAAAPLSFLTDGPLAVSIFFILSGIVLAAAVTAADARGARLGLTGLVLKRWLRLGLPIFAAGLVVLALLSLQVDRSIAIGWASESSWMRKFFPPAYDPALFDILREAFVTAFIGPDTPVHDPVLWTIRIEFPGSLLIFLLALYLPAGLPRLCIGLVTGIALALVPQGLPGGWIANYCSLFALGLVLHDLAWLDARRAIEPGAWRGPAGITLVIFGLCLFPLFGLSVYDPAATPPDPAKQAILGSSQIRAALVVAGVMLSPGLQQFLANALSGFLGRISFGLYLLHAPLIWSFGGLAYLPLQPLLGHVTAATSASVAVATLAIAVAWLFHYGVEQPSMKLSARIAARVSWPPSRVGCARPKTAFWQIPESGTAGDSRPATGR